MLGLDIMIQLSVEKRNNKQIFSVNGKIVRSKDGRDTDLMRRPREEMELVVSVLSEIGFKVNGKMIESGNTIAEISNGRDSSKTSN